MSFEELIVELCETASLAFLLFIVHVEKGISTAKFRKKAMGKHK